MRTTEGSYKQVCQHCTRSLQKLPASATMKERQLLIHSSWNTRHLNISLFLLQNDKSISKSPGDSANMIVSPLPVHIPFETPLCFQTCFIQHICRTGISKHEATACIRTPLYYSTCKTSIILCGATRASETTLDVSFWLMVINCLGTAVAKTEGNVEDSNPTARRCCSESFIVCLLV